MIARSTHGTSMNPTLRMLARWGRSPARRSSATSATPCESIFAISTCERRLPPLGSFAYVWEARGPASAGVWIYHDHSICDGNVARGALGLIVVHNPADKLNEVDITPARLPDGSWTGSPLVPKSIPIKKGTLGILDQPAVDHGPTPGQPRGTLRIGNLVIEVDKTMGWVTGVNHGTYREPP